MTEVEWDADLYSRQHKFVYQYGEDLIEWLNPRPGERILDVGCGTGQLTSKIGESGAIVTGIDASPEMIRGAKESFANIQFFVKDASAFSFEIPFDAVFSNAALHWITRQKEALACIFNVLRPNGRFVFEMGGKHNVETIHNALKRAMKEEGLEDAIPPEQNYFPSVAEQCSLLEAAGFTVSDVKYFKRPTKLEGDDGMKLWIRQFCGFFFRNVSEESRARITDEAIGRLRTTIFIDGHWIADYVRLRIKAVK